MDDLQVDNPSLTTKSSDGPSLAPARTLQGQLSRALHPDKNPDNPDAGMEGWGLKRDATMHDGGPHCVVN